MTARPKRTISGATRGRSRTIWRIWVPFMCPKCKTRGRVEAHINRCVTIVKGVKDKKEGKKDELPPTD